MLGNRLEMKEQFGLQIDRQRRGEDGLIFNNYGIMEHWRGGMLLNIIGAKNLVTNEGKDKLLDVHYHGATQITTWYLGLINNTSYSAVAAGDTMSSHAGWIEFTTYSDSTRQAWVEAAASSQSITSSSSSVFNINGSGTVKGFFVCSDSTKSGTTGTLNSTIIFGTAQTVENGDTLRLTYTVNL